MKPKQLVPLVIVMAVLAGIVFLRQSQEESPNLIEQVQLQQLLPGDLQPADIARIELHAGGQAEEALTLERAASGEGWLVTTHFDAPVKSDKIDGFLDTLTGLQGEFRAAASGDGLGAYDLQEEVGFHFKGFAEGADEPLFHLVTGKGPSFGNAFARAADGEDVYVIDLNLRREAGLYTLDLSDPPMPGIWLDKEVLRLEKAKIKKVALSYPDKALAFEYQLVEQPEATHEEEESDEEAEEEATPPAPPLDVYEWVVVSGGTGIALNPTALSNLTQRLSTVNASDVVDPAKKAEWNLENPIYTCRITIDGQPDEIVLEVGKPAEGRDAYLRVASSDKDIVYKINGYDFEQIFTEGGAFFELPGVLVDAADVSSIEYTTDEGQVVLSKTEEAWTVTEPKSDATLIDTKLDDVARTLISWKATDYADSLENTGLDTEPRSVSFKGEGLSHTIVVGDESPSGKGRYARLDQLDQVLVMSTRDHADIFVSPSEFFERDVFDLDEAEITQIEVTQGDQAYELAKSDEGWTITEGDVTSPADESATTDLRLVLSSIAGEKLLFDATAAGELLGTIALTTEDGQELKLNVHVEQEGMHALTVPGRMTGYWVTASDAERLLPDADTLKPEPAPEEEAEPADESVDDAEPADESVDEAEPADESVDEATPDVL